MDDWLSEAEVACFVQDHVPTSIQGSIIFKSLSSLSCGILFRSGNFRGFHYFSSYFNILLNIDVSGSSAAKFIHVG